MIRLILCRRPSVHLAHDHCRSERQTTDAEDSLSVQRATDSPLPTLFTPTTWHAPNGQVHNQIDFILTPQRSSINKANIRFSPDVDIGSDHDLVLTTLKFKLKTKRFSRSTRIRFDLEKLRGPEIAEVLQTSTGRKFAALSVLDSDVDTFANSVKEVALSTAEELFGRQRKKIQPLVTNEVLDLCDQRQQLKEQMYTHWSRTRVQEDELRSQEEAEGRKEWVDLGAVQEHREGNDVRKQQRRLQHPRGSHQHPTAWVSSHRRQQLKHPDRKHSPSEPSRLSTAVAYTTTCSTQTLTRPPHKSIKPTYTEGRGWRGCAQSESREVSRSGQNSLWVA